MAYSKFLSRSLYIAYKLPVKVNCISVPCSFDLTCASSPVLAFTTLYNCKYLVKNLSLFMSYINRKINIIRNTGMNARVTYYLTCCVNQITVTELVNLLMEIAQSFCCCKKCITSFRHRKCSRMSCLSIKSDTIVEHAENAVNHTDIISGIFKNRTLFNMCFKHILIFVRRYSVFSVALEFRCIKCITECCFSVNNTY